MQEKSDEPRDDHHDKRFVRVVRTRRQHRDLVVALDRGARHKVDR
jgi:hypothetical protein